MKGRIISSFISSYALLVFRPLYLTPQSPPPTTQRHFVSYCWSKNKIDCKQNFKVHVIIIDIKYEENIKHKKKEMPTARGVPKRSPIQVLTTPNVA